MLNIPKMLTSTILVAAIYSSSSSLAQDLSSHSLPPEVPSTDRYGVNILTATWSYSHKERLHSEIDPDLDFYLFDGDGGMLWGSSLQGYITVNKAGYGSEDNVVIGNRNFTFKTVVGSGSWNDKYGKGSTLNYNASDKTYILKTSDGTKYIFGTSIFNSQPAGSAANCVTGKVISTAHECGALVTMISPNGKTVSYEYDTSYDSPSGNSYKTYARLRAARSSLGLSVMVNYASQFAVSSVRMINDSYERCDYAARTCATNIDTWPKITYTQELGTTLSNGQRGLKLSTVDQFGNSSSYETALYASYFRALTAGISPISEVVYKNDQGRTAKGDPSPPSYLDYTSADGMKYSYKYANVAGPSEAWYEVHGTRTSSEGRVYSFVGNRVLPISNVVTQETDEIGRTTLFNYDQNQRPISIQFPEGNIAKYSYDANGNITSIVRSAKTGSALADTSEKWVYQTPCVDTLICNKPASMTDKRGNVTNYTYDVSHGGVLTATGPADANGIQPVKRSAYVQRYAWLSNGSGGYVPAATPVWLLSTEKTCRTSATSGDACTGGSGDQVVTIYEYGPDAGPSNLLLRGIAVTADGTTRRTCYGYDTLGNRISETKPRPDLVSCP